MEYKDKKYTYLGGLMHGISTLATGMKTSIKVYFRKKVTEQYPENRKELKMFDRFRGTLNMPHNENNEHRCVACGLCQMYAIGIAYALGVLIQFIANNIVNNNLAESIMLCVGLIVLVYYGFGTDSMAANSARAADGRASYIVYKNEKTAGITLIIIVALMTCIFSTLDNAVTLVHAEGSVDIGQTPRVILAVSGLVAGYVFGINKGAFINIIMYCVTLLSVMCVAVIELGGPFMIGLVAFYMSAGFFVVYFTTMFIQFSYNTDIPELCGRLQRCGRRSLRT